MGCLKCLKVSTIPLALIVFIFYVIALSSHYWTTCDTWKYNNGLWQKCVNEECERLYESSVQYRYRDARCNSKANQYYIMTNTQCKKYYRCLNGAYDEFECAAGEQFNEVSGACEGSAPAGCPDLRCDGLSDNVQYTADGTICKSWKRCVSGVYESQTCPNNEYWNQASKTCQSNVPAGCRDPKCDGKEGWYINNLPDCTSYYTCTSGVLLDNQNCPANTVVNPTAKTCSGSAESTACKDPRCKGKADDYYVDNNRCESYYQCNSEKRTDYTCTAPTRYYDTSTDQCVQTRPSNCIDYRCYNTGMGTAHFTDNNRCTSWYACTAGAYTSGSCPTSPQEYYNTITKQCTTTVPMQCAHPNCYNNAPGWYISDSPTCRNYYECHAGETITASQSCPANTVVDVASKTCSSTATAPCKDPRCLTKADGDYIVSGNNWCKEYFTCTSEVYVGKRCVANQYFDTAAKACSSTKPSGCYDERCESIGVSTGWSVNDNTCAAGFRCNNGVYETKSCTSGEQLNTASGTCQTTTPTGCRDSRCDGKSNGYYYKNNQQQTCLNWERCVDGIYSSGSCVSTQVFVISSDIQSGSCQTTTASGSTTCKDPRCTASPNSYGWRDKVNSRCRYYYQCANGFYTERDCGAYQYWDNSNNVCTATKPAGCNDQRCYGLSNGKYRVNRDCIDYFTCANYVTTATASCTGGTRFQQTTGTCVSISAPAGCKVDGGYSTWSLWGACSVTTGYGTKTRTRTCTNPSPVHGGANCDALGDATETTLCWACPAADWVSASRACFTMATVGAFLALFWSILINCSTSRHPLCTGGALFLLALCAGMAGLIVYHSNISDVPGCELETGWSMVLGWLGVILAAIGYIVAMIAMCQAGETRVSSSDGIQMRGKAT